MFKVEDIKNYSVKVDSGNMDDGWYLARPTPGVFIDRLKDAWQVLIGKADAIKWTNQ